MSNETTLTIAGNLVDDPELRFTPSGQPVKLMKLSQTKVFVALGFERASSPTNMTMNKEMESVTVKKVS